MANLRRRQLYGAFTESGVLAGIVGDALTDPIFGLNGDTYGGTNMIVGDSLGETGFSGAQTVKGGFPSLSGQNFFAIACALAGGIFDRHFDASTTGKTTREIIDGSGTAWNSLADNLAYAQPRHVFNPPLSVNNLAQGVSADQTISESRIIWDTELAFPTVEHITICTVHATGAANLGLPAASVGRDWYRRVNAAVYAYQAANPDKVTVIRFAEAVDAADKSGPKAGWSNDTTHLNYAGGPYTAVAAVLPEILKWKAPRAWAISTSALEHTNLIGPAAAMSTNVAIGSADSGTGTLQTGCSGNLPMGVGARQAIGEAAGATVVCTSIPAPKGYGERSARAIITAATIGGGGFLRFRDALNAAYCYHDAARAVRTYAQGECYAISATLMATVLASGLTAGTAPDVSNLVEGDVFTDGAAKFIVQRRFQITDKVEVSVDLSFVGTGQCVPQIALNVIDTAGTTVPNLNLHYVGGIGQTTLAPWASDINIQRAVFRQTFDLSLIPTLVGGIRNFGVRVGSAGAVGSVADLTVHAVKQKIVP